MNDSPSIFNRGIDSYREIDPLSGEISPTANQESLSDEDALWQSLSGDLQASSEGEKIRIWKDNLDCLSRLGRGTKLLIAAVEPQNFTLCYGNPTLCQLAGIQPSLDSQSRDDRQRLLHHLLQDHLSEGDRQGLEQLYRRQVLLRILGDRYGIDLKSQLGWDEPAIVSFQSPNYSEPRMIEFWVNAAGLKIIPLDPDQDEFADLRLEQHSRPENPESLTDLSTLESLEQRVCWENYRVEGLLLLEGVDVTIRETIRQISQLLISTHSILRPDRFRQINQHLKSLFRCDNSFILSTERDPVRLFVETESRNLSVTSYPLDSLQGSHFLQAAAANRIWNVTNLSADWTGECEKQLVEAGVRSLLLIPLVVQVSGNDSRLARRSPSQSQQMVGLVGLTKSHPHHFHSIDIRRGEELVAPFTVALRQIVQQRLTQFTNIHPSVEWRFIQELERRSWGLPPEAIIFAELYPLYGISDIRGSSDERNRAIEADLIEQFQLGLAVVEAVCTAEEQSFVEQLRLDLLERIEGIQRGVTVDGEVTAIEYLKDHLEGYFDYFCHCSPLAAEAVATYRAACDNEHDCVYVARSRYDETVNQINARLRDTWEIWQEKMQKIIPHYCDVECSDGIDHMIYAGAAINPSFSRFHLHSLRYEQLRAVCDCARVALRIQADYQTTLQVTHLVLVQDCTVDIFHDEKTERLFDVRGTRDTRYEIVKKRIDKGVEAQTGDRITQPGMLTVVYATNKEWEEYEQYLRYLAREGWVADKIEFGTVEPQPGVSGLKFARVRVLPASNSLPDLALNGSPSLGE
ncbi:GAF domain-containing protein [Phormidium pseudopriestleyi FRX01]|uniref:GAF domain-containing protein n=1 Tax=Phormidium pseudopriestleyi FRX01 TaxID=1759528 RepID=A0ABS3FN35_9CYAN|nr:GAF domain-containing protein [Phormidium pseudopriestleyi]MBO0348287.1 GAF domain-containing protein [Phormidium pseudopriestleyi FRX01]